MSAFLYWLREKSYSLHSNCPRTGFLLGKLSLIAAYVLHAPIGALEAKSSELALPIGGKFCDDWEDGAGRGAGFELLLLPFVCALLFGLSGAVPAAASTRAPQPFTEKNGITRRIFKKLIKSEYLREQPQS